MAARKSCTHLTWAEAKAKVGGSTASTKTKKLIPKNIDHGKALTAKIVSKNSASKADISKEKTLLKRAKREEERALAAAAKRAEERERERIEAMVKPFDQAKERMVALAKSLQEEDASDSQGSTIMDCNNGGIDDDCHEPRDLLSSEMMLQIAECRELQWNEVMGLEAIYADTGEFLIAKSSKISILQQHIEQWQMDEGDEIKLQNIVRHPPTSFTLQLTVDGTCEGSDLDIAACLLLKVTMPSHYPLDESYIPTFEILYFMATDREAVCNPDKPLESLAYLEESLLIEALQQEAMQILPDPCVYEVMNACLMERMFEFVKMSIHAQHVTCAASGFPIESFASSNRN